MKNLPISLDLLEKRKEIPVRIAELSYVDKDKAIHFMRLWGERAKPISTIHDEVTKVWRSKVNEDGGSCG